ncbi:MAG: phosphotransferase [Planctomycetota bacterium]
MRSRAAPLDELRRLCHVWLATREFSLEPLAGGFSGSPLFLVRTPDAAHVLKAFAPGTSPGRARFVHALVRHLRRRGVAEVPAVLDPPAGESFLADREGRLWELQAFVAGQPVTAPSLRQVGSALEVLARLHAAAAEMPENPPDTGPSPGIARRVEQARAWLASPWHRLRDAAASSTAGGPLARLVAERLGAACDRLRAADGERIIAAVAAIEPQPVGRQAVLRDVWAAHVLFDAPATDRVTGVIDVHAAATDTPATDLGRLLGSWMTADAVAPEWWAERLVAYDALPQAEGALRLVPFLAASGILFGLDNWFRWVLEAGRTFDRPDEVTARLDWLVSMLPTALEILANRRNELGLTAENCSL